MFNDLNNANNQKQPAVDDIFAETDNQSASITPGDRASSTKGASNPAISGSVPLPGGAPNADIETHRMGLNSAEGGDEDSGGKSGGRWFKIILILIVVAIVGLGSYLVYSKFFNGQGFDLSPVPTEMPEELIIPEEVLTTEVTDLVDSEVDTELGSFVSPGASGEEELADNVEVLTPDETIPTSFIDSDGDGLSDEEEQLLGANPNLIDTDNDGLSDYEEVNIFGTDPIKSDTDGDNYSDGDEVKNGYNPLGAGTLSEVAADSQ